MSSDEEYLDELLKSMVEDEGKSGSTDSVMDDLANGNLEGADFVENGEGIPDIGNLDDFAINDLELEEEPIDFAIEDIGTGEETSGDFAIEDIGTEEEPVDDMEEEMSGGFTIEDTGTGEETPGDFGIEDFVTEEEPSGNFINEDFSIKEEVSEDYVTEDSRTEEDALNDFAIEDSGTEEDALNDFAIEDSGTEEDVLNDFAIEDSGTEGVARSDFSMENSETETDSSTDLVMEDSGSEEEASPDFAIEDFGIEEEPPADYGIEDTGMGESVESTYPEEAVDDFAIEDFGVIEPDEGELAALEESQFSEDDIDAMFAAADVVAQDESFQSDFMQSESLQDEPSQNESPEIEINSEEDMLALLDSMSNEIEAEQAAAEQAAALAAESEAAAGNGEEGDGKGKKKKKKLFGGRKKDNGEASDNTEGAEEELSEEPAKPQGFFSKFISFLTESDEEEESTLKEGLEPSDENKSILEELDKEDKKKKKKKDKGKKGKEDEEEEAPKKEKKEKKKKEKKEKKDAAAADALETVPEKPSKRISRKSVGVIAGMGLTLTAMVIVLCSVVPAFFDKQEARAAYYNADYKKSFELLYGKTLDDSDTIIYNQSLTIMEITRKLEAYHNYLAIGEEVRALDALMTGVQKYPDILLKAEEFHVINEVDAVYETMLSILNDKYGISEGDAQVVIAYDDVTYTRKLESVVNGTPFADPGAEVQAAADVLSEEQDFYESVPENVLEADTGNEENANGDMQTEVPEDIQEDTSDGEDTAGEQEPAAGIEADNVLGTDMNSGDSYIPEEPLPEDNFSESPVQEMAPSASEDTGSSSGSQGKMIQGVRQPIEVQIHGN